MRIRARTFAVPHNIRARAFQHVDVLQLCRMHVSVVLLVLIELILLAKATQQDENESAVVVELNKLDQATHTPIFWKNEIHQCLLQTERFYL